jgi:hypothetical protein
MADILEICRTADKYVMPLARTSDIIILNVYEAAV